MTSPRPRRSPARTSAVFLLAASLAVAPAVVAPAAFALSAPIAATAPATYTSTSTDQVQWSVSPADAEGPDGRISLRHVLDPGSTAEDTIAVANTGTTPATFDVRAGDGVVGSHGAFDVAPGEPEDAGRWITIGGTDAGALAIPAGETRMLPVTIAVPADAVPGDHPGGVVVGLSQRSDDDVTVQHRIGVRVHLQVSGEIVPSVTVDDVSSSYDTSWNPLVPGTLHVTYTLSNPGNIRLGASETVNASGAFGLAPTLASGVDPLELLPGDTVTRVHELSVPPLFVLGGEVVISPVALGADDITLPAAAIVEFSTLAVPWAAVLVALFAIGTIVVVIATRRRRRAHAPA